MHVDMRRVHGYRAQPIRVDARKRSQYPQRHVTKFDVILFDRPGREDPLAFIGHMQHATERVDQNRSDRHQRTLIATTDEIHAVLEQLQDEGQAVPVIRMHVQVAADCIGDGLRSDCQLDHLMLLKWSRLKRLGPPSAGGVFAKLGRLRMQPAEDGSCRILGRQHVGSP
ncbi:hypothetical protein SMALB_6149 [Streptomyces malaysiensis]|uniref:Uncharacterized protein n=1 Tax=Streptomyces malaysiensis TaxID=92644 RepID=A0A7X5X7J8_STRMQ|nr:hypothetical protein [Streptomyces malaysiensis]